MTAVIFISIKMKAIIGNGGAKYFSQQHPMHASNHQANARHEKQRLKNNMTATAVRQAGRADHEPRQRMSFSLAGIEQFLNKPQLAWLSYSSQCGVAKAMQVKMEPTIRPPKNNTFIMMVHMVIFFDCKTYNNSFAKKNSWRGYYFSKLPRSNVQYKTVS